MPREQQNICQSLHNLKGICEHEVVQGRDAMCSGEHEFIPAGNTAKVRLNYQTPGGTANNVLYFRQDVSWTSETLTALAEQVASSWNDFLSPITSVDVTLFSVEAIDVGVPSGAGVVVGADITGTLNSPVLPSNVTLSIKFGSGFTGRSRRGRMYFVGLTEIQVAGDEIVDSAQDSLIDNITAFFNEITDTLHVDHVIVSYCSNGEWRVDAVTTIVTSYSSDFIIDSMRRRLSGRGA